MMATGRGLYGMNIAIIGAGPAGLIAAEVLSAKGLCVDIYERKASPARKFLLAGRGGLNLTHSEDFAAFMARYTDRAPILDSVIRAFPPRALREWCEGLGEKTFIGTSGRVFPESFKATPLLRAWLARLERQGVRFHLNHDWQGWDGAALLFSAPGGPVRAVPDATLLALGGASWPRLGSDGGWTDMLAREGVNISPLVPSNCGFGVAWSDVFRTKFAGQPLKSVAAYAGGQHAHGEMMITAPGIEGGAVYALSRALREGGGPLIVDLKPDLDVATVAGRLAKPRGRESFSNHLRKTLNLPPVAIGLVMERADRGQLGSYAPERLAQIIKRHEIPVTGPLGIERAISSAGGVTFDALDANAMLREKPGVFAAGEMLDWEAPTGGYLLQACFATGVYAAHGIMAWLAARP